MVTTMTYPVAPSPTPLKGTLLDAATVTDGGFAWNDGRDLYESYNCMEFSGSAVYCGPNTKDLSQTAGWQSGFRFAAYGGVTCSAVGLDEARMLSEVRRVFESGESTAVEAALMEIRFAAAAGENLGRWEVTEDITPAAGAVPYNVGLALLEGFAARNYVGAPTLHVPTVVASLVMHENGAVMEGDLMRTRLGSKYAVGAGYDLPNLGPTGAAAAAGERWLYATGEVSVQRSEPVIRQAIEEQKNEVVVLAERGYVASVDCFTAAIRVTLS